MSERELFMQAYINLRTADSPPFPDAVFDEFIRLRQGYKLVPLQPNNKIIVSIERIVENQIEASGITQDPFRLDGEKIYKAMIGGVE